MTSTLVSPTNPGTAEMRVARRKRSSLDFAMLLALGMCLVYYVISIITSLLNSHPIPPPVIIFSAIYAVCAIVVAIAFPFAEVIPLVLMALDTVGSLAGPGFITYTLTHPNSNHSAFALFAVTIPAQMLVCGLALAKLVHRIRKTPPRFPLPVIGFTGGAIGLMIAALLLGLTFQGSSSAPVSTTAGNENVAVAGGQFAPNIVALHTGDTLTIIDSDSVPHELTNGTWSKDNKPMPGVETGAVVLNNLNVTSGSVKVGPFTTPGTYHIYCTVHPGMSLTIIVQ